LLSKFIETSRRRFQKTAPNFGAEGKILITTCRW